MRRFFTIGLIGMATLGLQAQQTDTLRHLPANATRMAWMMSGTTNQGTPEWGSYLGHNIYGDEEFGEKYAIQNPGNVVGVIAYLGGHSGGTNKNANFRVRAVGGNGLPAASLGNRSIRISELNLSGETPQVVIFNNPIAVQDEFFVTMDLGDYSHDAQVLDTIYLKAGEDGSRPISDHAVFGRNVVRWHSHGSPAWRDFFTQNFSPYSIYFAIHPIVQFSSASVVHLANDNIKIQNIFPNPSADFINVEINNALATPFRFDIMDMNGRIVESQNRALTEGLQTVTLDLSNLQAGNYILSLGNSKDRFSTIIVKK